MRCTIGLVEDDDVIRENYADFLKARGFGVRHFAEREAATRAFAADLPDIAVLDVALGDERDGGFRLCWDLRRLSSTLPVIFLTSYDSEADRISGLRIGGDDYLSKDGSFEYLAVRIETLLQRRQAILEGGDRRNNQMIVGPLAIDPGHTAICWKGQPIDLSLTHYWMVAELATSAPGEAKTASELMTAANISVAPNTVAAHIRTIRARFRAIDPEFDAIRTERGHGYRWSL